MGVFLSGLDVLAKQLILFSEAVTAQRVLFRKTPNATEFSFTASGHCAHAFLHICFGQPVREVSFKYLTGTTNATIFRYYKYIYLKTNASSYQSVRNRSIAPGICRIPEIITF